MDRGKTDPAFAAKTGVSGNAWGSLAPAPKRKSDQVCEMLQVSEPADR
jgi:hypothetical protein